MSFAMGVKEDLTRIVSSKPCCRKAELAAFLRLNGNLRQEEAGVALSMVTENAAIARKIFTLAKECGLSSQIAVHRKVRLKKNQVFSLRVLPQEALQKLLRELQVVDNDGRWRGFGSQFESVIINGECCKRAYLRGVFQAAGYISDPEGAYHLEISLPDLQQVQFVQRLLAGFEIGAKMTRRKGMFVLYLKEGEQICHLLNILGSHRSLLEFESMRVDKEMRNQVNRLVNCDKANVDKTVAAAFKQVESIEIIERLGGLQQLSKPLREMAELRKEYPEASLSELSETSGLGRSAINHRLRKLVETAEELSCRG
jgi:DNA-binding protein WhiA